MSTTTSNCVCSDQLEPNKTLTLTHDFSSETTTMTFTKESQIFSFSVQNDSSIIKQALEETLLHI